MNIADHQINSWSVDLRKLLFPSHNVHTNQYKINSLFLGRCAKSFYFCTNHVEIDNGYGVPGGAAYYGSLKIEVDKESEKKPATRG